MFTSVSIATESSSPRHGYRSPPSASWNNQSLGAVWKSTWPSWAFRLNQPYGFRGRIAILNHAQALVTVCPKLQALIYDILPSTTAVFSYAIGSRKLSANERCFVCAQTVVSLLQTTQIKQGVSFIAANKVYTSTNKIIIVWIETELFSYQG